VGEIAHLASTSESGTGFQPVICDTHSQDGCAPLVSTGGAPLYQASILGDFQRTVSSQMVLKLAPFRIAPERRSYRERSFSNGDEETCLSILEGQGVALSRSQAFRWNVRFRDELIDSGRFLGKILPHRCLWVLWSPLAQ
jgi:hypothetical protein